MSRKHSFLRYSTIIVSVTAVGFLTAFFVDHSPTFLNKILPANAISSIKDFSITKNTSSNQIENSEENQNNHSLILPVVNKLGEFFGINKSLTSIGKEWGAVEGLTMFRGSPTRTWYGKGPLPQNPKVEWKYPEKPMCSFSKSLNENKEWCGSGWTGQPVVWERPDGITEVIFGAYDGAVHFVNAQNGKDTRPAFQTGDIIKGSVTLDPDGFPLLYFGSRDNKLRILSLDQDIPTEIWALNADEVIGKWNNDWDGNPVVIDDILFEGGENSWFFAIKLNRQLGVNGKVSVNPNIIFKIAGWTDELIKNIGDEMVSIESSVVFYGERVYFVNSGGRVVGLDISNINKGLAPIVFDYWVGDDADATMIVDEKGMLYVSVELERFTERSAELGQFIKLNPYEKENPFIWGIQIPKGEMPVGGIWATPAIGGNYLYVATHSGKLLTVEKETGNITNEDFIGTHAWSSPAIIDNSLLVATCYPGTLRIYSLVNPDKPKLGKAMSLPSGSCIESTPAVWKGQIFVGARDGYFYSFADK